jgi:hypothetical protein
MKKRLLLLGSLLLGTLLFATPTTAVAQHDTLLNHNGANVRVGTIAEWLTGAGSHSLGTINLGTIGTPYSLGAGIDGSIAGVATDAGLATNAFTLGNINVFGQVNRLGGFDNLYGFLYQSALAFDGTINLGSPASDVNVHAVSGEVGGVYFRGAAGGKQDITGSSIAFNNISVTSNDDGAFGFAAKMIGTLGGGLIPPASVTLNKVTATATNTVGTPATWATAVELQGMYTDGSLTIKDSLNAHANTEAIGLKVMDSLAGTVDIRGIDVKSGLNAYGIVVGYSNTDPVKFNGGVLVPGVLGGTLNVGAGGIKVEGVTFAAGIGVSGQVAGDVTVAGKIDVKSAGDAVGFGSHAGGLNAGNTVKLGDIKVVSTTTNAAHDAAGVRFTGDVAGKLTTGDIYVESDRGNAFGVHVARSDLAPLVSAGITGLGSEFGKITVISNNVTGKATEEPTAAGIWTADGATFTLKDDITVKAQPSPILGLSTNAYGVIVGGKADIRIAKSLEIKADGACGNNIGIDTAEDLNLTLINSNLTTNSVSVRGNLAGEGLKVTGNGYADLGAARVVGDTTVGAATVGGTTVAIDGAKMLDLSKITPGDPWQLVGPVNVNNDNTLIVYGNVKPEDLKKVISGEVKLNQRGHFRNESIFTDWKIVGGQIVAAGTRERAYANDNYLAASTIHNKYTGWDAVRDHLISGASQSTPQYGYGYYGQVPKTSRSSWVNYVGRDSHYRSSFSGSDWNIGTNGVQVGSDIFRFGGSQLGTFFGYEGTTGSNLYRDVTGTNRRDSIRANDYYVGMYGVHVFGGGADVRTIFNFGWQNYDSQRNHLLGTYVSSFKGNTAELNVELGKRRYFGAWSARPAIALDWFWTHLDGATETGAPASAAIRYGKTDHSQLFFRFGTDFRFEQGRWAVESGLFYSYDMRGADMWSRASSVDGTNLHSALVGSKLGRSVLSSNIGGSWQAARNFTIFGGYRAELSPERAGNNYIGTGYVGGAWRW